MKLSNLILHFLNLIIVNKHVMANQMFSFSFTSSDCSYVTPDGGYVFKMTAHAPRMQAAKVGLGTLELPLSQWPIEDAWNRVYFGEGIRLTPECHQLTVTETFADSPDMSSECQVLLPVYLTPIIRIQVLAIGDGGRLELEITTVGSHWLWPEPASIRSAAEGWYWGDPVRLVATPLGDVAFDPSKLTFLSHDRFRVSGAMGTLPPTELNEYATADLGYLHAPTIPGPAQLAELVEQSLVGRTRQSYRAWGDATTGGLVLSTEQLHYGTARVSILGDRMAHYLGVQGTTAMWHAGDQWDPQSDRLTASENPTLLGQYGHSTAPERPDPQFQLGGRQAPQFGVGVACLPLGWYDASVRPVGVIGRHALSSAWKISLNRLYFGPPASTLPQVDANGTPILSHWWLFFADSTGVRHRVTIPMGNYTATVLADYLTAAMSRLARSTQAAAVTVTYDPTAADATLGRFRFSLSGSGGSGVVPAPPRFALEFGLANNTLDPERLGFDRVRYAGASTYASPNPVAVPNLNRPGEARSPRGVWGVDILGEERRLRFTCDAHPDTWIAPRLLQQPDPGVVELDVYSLSGRPWVHGLHPGDVVQLRRCDMQPRPPALLLRDLTGSLVWQATEQVDSSVCSALTLVVSDLQTQVNPLDRPSAIAVHGAYAGGSSLVQLIEQGTWFLCPESDIYPSLYTNPYTCPGTISAEMLGLTPISAPAEPLGPAGTVGFDANPHRRAFVWGTVGDNDLHVSDEFSLHSWPLSSWAIYRFDPPELALVYFNEGRTKGSALLQHVSGGQITTPMARLNLGSLHREGGLRSEFMTASLEPLTTFEVRFANPDGSRYRMHGATFSFTLNVVAA